MKKYILLLLFVPFLNSCAYNSRNLFTITGNRMNFSYGLISIKNADKIILLRETNMGEGEAKYNIPDMGQYMCPVKAPAEASSVDPVPVVEAESKEADLLEMNEIKPPEPVEPVNL